MAKLEIFDPAPKLIVASFLLLLLLPAISAEANLISGSPFGTYGTMFSRESLWKIFGVTFLVLHWKHLLGAGYVRPQIPLIDTFLLIALAIFSLAITIFWAPSPWLSFQQTFVLIMVILVGYSAYWGFANLHKAYSNRAYFAALFGIVLHMPLVFFVLYLRNDIPDYPWEIGIPGVRGIRPYNFFLEVAIAVGLGMLALKTHYQAGMFRLIFLAVILCWMMLFWSGGRGAILSLGLSLLVVSAMFPQHAKRLFAFAVLTAVAGLGPSFLIWVPPAEGYGALNMFQRSLETDVNVLSTGRLVVWRYGFDYFMDSPFLGYGLNQFRILFSVNPPFSVAPPPHAHNILLGALLSWGLIGGSLAVVLAARLWAKLFSRLRNAVSLTQLPAFLALVALSVHSLVSGTYHHVPSVFYIALFAGICLAPNPAQNENTNG